MKLLKYSIVLLFAFNQAALSQGTLIFDQQSSSDEFVPDYGLGNIQQMPLPWGQSFTPALPGIDFIRFKMSDASASEGPVSVYVNLVSGSVSGTVIGTTASVSVGQGYRGNPTFLFPTTVPLIPGTAYYLEPMVQGIGGVGMASGPYNYAGGSAWLGGSPNLASDFWFREGLVPEPSCAVLLIAGALLAFEARRLGRTKNE